MNIDTLPGRYWAGRASVEAGGTIVTPQAATWAGNVWGDDLFFLPSQPMVPPQRIQEVNADGEIVLAYPWPGVDAVEEEYEVRYVGIIERSTAQTRRVLEQLGDIKSWADIFVPMDADRLALETEDRPLPTGYRVLVIDGGLIWAKKTGAYDDWLPPVEFKGDRGDAGPFTEITFGAVTTGAAGTSASANIVVIDADTIRIDLTIPKGLDGTGTGDVVGPAGAVANRLAVFDGATGKLLKDGGAVPVVAALASQAEAEAGADNAKTMTALRVAQAIAALTTPFDPHDLDLTVSQLALQVADIANVALFLGPSGNMFADSFDTLTSVDVAGATNLDTSVAGLLKPTVTASALISAATGTATGSATSFGGLAAAFDGTTSQGSGSCAVALGTASATVGKNYSASPKAVSSAKAWPSSDVGHYDGGSATSLVINLRAKQTAPSSPSDGTLLGTTGSFADDSATKTITSNDVSTAWNYVWLEYVANASTNLICAEAQFFAPGVTNNLTVRSASFTAAVASTKMKALIRVKEVDAATAGTDYTLECSRDGGTTWAAMTLTELFTSPSPTAGIRVVEAAETSVSGQPSGTAPRMRYKTLNNKMVEFHDGYIYWS